jgi:hypothetical protein
LFCTYWTTFLYAFILVVASVVSAVASAYRKNTPPLGVLSPIWGSIWHLRHII